MKLAFMTWVAPDWSLEQHLTAAIRYGYDALEPRCGNQKHGVELSATKRQRADIKSQCEDCGVEIACVATSLKYNLPQPEQIAEAVEETKRYLQLAADLGSPNLRVFGGLPVEETTLEESQDRVAAALAQCVKVADKCGVNLCLETHDRFCRSAETAGVINRVDHPRLGYCWDILHTARMGETAEESWENLQGQVYHCHIHDYTWPEDDVDQLTPALTGAGQVPHAEAIRLLAAAGYAGALSGEWISCFPPEEILPQSASELREYLRGV
ncbi:MAG TPA: sugar phosphate isomerase/epimerase family protein [Armatimonadota bacterium]|jgi:sugar phosphate isomerase/epimerase